MSQPVKLSDALVIDARMAGEAEQRSIAGQVEYWARLGRSLDELLEGRARRALSETGKQRLLSELISSAGTVEGRARLKAYLGSRPFPHFEPHPHRKGFLIRIEEDGTRSVGRFVNRQFVEDREAEASRIQSVRDMVDQLGKEIETPSKSRANLREENVSHSGAGVRQRSRIAPNRTGSTAPRSRRAKR
jgi:ParD-like antitoxin of type II bacterial toxin-antitoxin system